jgi:hypothetical protein
VSDTAIVNTQQPWQLQEMINAVAEALFQHFGLSTKLPQIFIDETQQSLL